MRKNTLIRNRWFTAVAVTCLSGFALCGCARGTRDVGTSLKDNAAREAIEEERKIAERKRGESKALSSRDSIAAKERPAPPSKRDKGVASSGKNPFDRLDSAKGSSDLAMNPSKKPGKSASKNPKGDLATAEWAGDSLDRRVKTVSGEKASEDVDVAEPLLDSRGREVVASDLFDESDAPSSKKSDLKGKSASKSPKLSDESGSESEQGLFAKAKAQPVNPSSDLTEDHPWAKEESAPEKKTVGKSKDLLAKKPLSDISPEDLKDDPLASSEKASTASLKSHQKKQSKGVSDSTLEEAQQLEAKARVQSLLTQSKSLVNKGELRSAYRLAQQAQRVADSEDLYFSAGEEQPADAVRSVLMKIRFEESKLAGHKTSSAAEAVAELEDSKSKTKPKANKLVSHSREKFSNLPDGWSSSTPAEAEEQVEQASVYETPEKAGGSNSPWAKSEFVAAKPHHIEIKPGPARKTASVTPAFPDSQDQWRSVANEPMSIGKKSTGIQASGFASAQGASDKSKITHAVLPSTTEPTGPAEQLTATKPSDPSAEQSVAVAEQSEAAKSFPDKSHETETTQEAAAPPPVPGSLASTDDWRNQTLGDIAVNRKPLLVGVAPAPPAEPSVAKNLAADAMDDSLGVDVQEPAPAKPSDSKLWLIFASAAGAFALLFVRRPAKVARPAGSSR